MKKTVLSILLIISMFSFYSCDGDALPKVSASDAVEALSVVVLGYASGIGAMTDTIPGVEYTLDLASSTATFTFTSFDVSGFGSYGTMSGSIVNSTATTVYDLTLSGGSVVTIYMVVDSTGATTFEVNGHDMLSEVTITVTDN